MYLYYITSCNCTLCTCVRVFVRSVHVCARKKRLLVGKWRSNDSLKCSLWCNLLAAASSSFSCCQRWEWFSWCCCCCCWWWWCWCWCCCQVWWASYQQITTSWLLAGTMFFDIETEQQWIRIKIRGSSRTKKTRKCKKERESESHRFHFLAPFPWEKSELRLNRFITELRSEYDGVVGVLAPLFYRALPPLSS